METGEALSICLKSTMKVSKHTRKEFYGLESSGKI